MVKKKNEWLLWLLLVFAILAIILSIVSISKTNNITGHGIFDFLRKSETKVLISDKDPLLNSFLLDISEGKSSVANIDGANLYASPFFTECSSDNFLCGEECNEEEYILGYEIIIKKSFPVEEFKDYSETFKEREMKELIRITTDILTDESFKRNYKDVNFIEIIEKDNLIEKLNSKVFLDWSLGRISDEEAEKLDWCQGGWGCLPVGIGTCNNICLGGNSYVMPGVGCFEEKTLISLKEVGYKEIKDIKIGDFVVSYDFDSRELVHSKVIGFFEDYSDEFIIINDGKLKVTPSHKLYVLNKGWIFSKDIEKGDKLMDENLNEFIVSSVEKINLNQRERVYTLEVEPYNNFFANNQLVHNKPTIMPKTRIFEIKLTFYF